MPYNFSQLAQAVWANLGKIPALSQFPATGGDSDSIINNRIAEREFQPDDNYCVDATAIVVRDAGGAGAAPEGQMARINAYSGADFTYTLDTALTAPVAAGDIIAIADADMPLHEMMRTANLGLRYIGPFSQKNISLTTVAGQTEYALPEFILEKDILKVEYQGQIVAGDAQWRLIPDYDIIPGAGGATGLLVIPPRIPADRLLQITFDGDHPALTAYNSPVYVYPTLAEYATLAHILQWYNGTSSGGSDYWMQRENKAWDEVKYQQSQHILAHENRIPKFPSPSLLIRR